MNWIKTHKKEFYSFLILFVIVLLLILPGLTYYFNSSWIKGLDFPFIIGINILFVYGIYEVLKVVYYKEINIKSEKLSSSNEENKMESNSKIIYKMKKRNESLFWILFSLISISYSIFFLYFSFDFLFENTINYSLNYLLIVLMFLFIFWNLIFVLFKTIDLKDQFTISIVNTLLFLFSFGLVYLTIFFSFATIFLIVIGTSVSDMSAYFGGKKIGKNKIVSHISPSKTLEGFIIGFISSIFFALIWIFIFIFPNYSSSYLILTNKTWIFFIVSFLVSLFAPFGDLFFSKIKRSYEIKDFSSLIPGHGGLLDRIDSHIFTISISTLIFSLVVI